MLLLIFLLSTTCFANCYYIDNYFSEEWGVTGPFSPLENLAVFGMQCTGIYCDNIKFRVCDNYHLLGDFSQTSSYYSEEQGLYLCPKGRVLAGFRCEGAYCDNKYYYCQYPSNFRRGDAYYWTSWFSEEEGDMACSLGYVVGGVDCASYYCDNMRLACYQVLDEVSLSKDVFGCNYEGALAMTTLSNVLDTTTYTKKNARNECNINRWCNGVRCNSDDTKCYLMNGAIKDSSDSSQIFYWKFCDGTCTWTDWFSEEDGMPPPDDNVSNDKRSAITGLRCRGAYCDDISVRICDNLQLSGDYTETSHISEENPTKLCFSDKPVVSSIVCWGYYCDDKVLRCREPSNFALGETIYYTPAFSEEGPAMQQCPPNYVLVGLSCSGGYCDNIILVCQEYYMTYPCEIGEGTKCKDCTDSAARKFANQCSVCNDGYFLKEGLCIAAWYGQSASFWQKYGSGNTVVTISESSTFTRTDSVAVSVEDSANFHYGFGNGYAYSLCVGYSVGLIHREWTELCLMLNYYFEAGWDVGRAVSSSVESSLSYSKTKTCSVALNDNCSSGGGCQLYRWISMREEMPTLVTTFLETCDFFQKWGDSKSFPPNCVPGYCSDYDLQGKKSNDCVACDVMDAFIEPMQFCQYGFLKATGACCNIGCGNCEEDQCEEKLGGNGANQCCPSKFKSTCETFGETGCIVAGYNPETGTVVKEAQDPIYDYGWMDCGEGWFDVQYQGVANDYCRWVGSCGCQGDCSWWSCALAGSNMQYTAAGEYNEHQFQGPYDQGEIVPVTSAPYELNIQTNINGRRNLQPQPHLPFNISELFTWENLPGQQAAIQAILGGCGINLNDYASSVIWMPYPHVNSTIGTVTLTAIIVPSSDNSHAFQEQVAAHAPVCDEEISHFLGFDTVIEYDDYVAPARVATSAEDPHYPIEEDEYPEINDSDDGLSTGAIVGIVAAVLVSAAVIFLGVKYCILQSSTKDETLLAGKNYEQMTLN